MRITPNYTNPNFTSKITYNHPLKEAFKYAKVKANSDSIDDWNVSKEFINSINTIKQDSKRKSVTFNVSIDKKADTKDQTKEGKKCLKQVNRYASKLPKGNATYLDTLFDQINGAKALVSTLEERYSKVLAESIDSSKGLVEDLKSNYKKAINEELTFIEDQFINSKR